MLSFSAPRDCHIDDHFDEACVSPDYDSGVFGYSKTNHAGLEKTVQVTKTSAN